MRAGLRARLEATADHPVVKILDPRTLIKILVITQKECWSKHESRNSERDWYGFLKRYLLVSRPIAI